MFEAGVDVNVEVRNKRRSGRAGIITVARGSHVAALRSRCQIQFLPSVTPDAHPEPRARLSALPKMSSSPAGEASSAHGGPHLHSRTLSFDFDQDDSYDFEEDAHVEDDGDYSTRMEAVLAEDAEEDEGEYEDYEHEQEPDMSWMDEDPQSSYRDQLRDVLESEDSGEELGEEVEEDNTVAQPHIVAQDVDEVRMGLVAIGVMR